MKMRRTLASLLLLGLSTFAFYACTKEGSTGNDKAKMQVYLTDDPGDYDQVFIDVQDVKINYSTNPEEGWVSLNQVNRGSYDLLTLVNDKDTLLADAEINTGKVEQIRLVLGPNNYVVIDGQQHQLETPSAQQSGLKLNIHQDISEGIIYKLLMDFDVARSINVTGNGKYMLKPVIRTTLVAAGGSIKGFVKPSTVPTTVFAIRGTNDTITSTLTQNGSYVIKALEAGTYQLGFLPSDTPTHKIANLPGIVVNTGVVTTVDTLQLQ
ncbi:MAG TPA: DUF4382 domain-containing protein, partial [Chitinophagaceae bacterium]